MVEAGSFREDLYYRLVVVPIGLPPLRDRAEDIPKLVCHFLAKFKAKHGRSELTLPSNLLSHFCNFQWPGNVRQLENTVERAVLLSRGPEITLDDLPDLLEVVHQSSEMLPPRLPEEGVDLDAMERELIVRTFQKFGGNQTRAARFLHLSRRTLAYRLQKYGITHEIAGTKMLRSAQIAHISD